MRRLCFIASVVAAFGVCSKGSVALTYRFVPWVVADTTIYDLSTNPPAQRFAFGDTITLKVVFGTGFFGPGNLLTVSYDGDAGSADYRDRVAGDAPPVTIEALLPGQISTEPGNMVGPTFQGLQQRLNRDLVFTNNETAWTQWLAMHEQIGVYLATTRIVVIPVVHEESYLSGRTDLPVIGFAGLFIESLDSHSVSITGRVIPDPESVLGLPEPSSLPALLCGLGGIGALSRRRTIHK